MLNKNILALWQDARFVTSTALTIVGTIATLRKNVSDLTERKTLRSKKEKEQANLADLVDLRRKLDALESEPYSAIRRQADSEVNESSQRLSSLITEELELSKDPNSKLSLAQRLFLLFRPVGLRAEIIHSFAYFFMFVMPLLILVLAVWSPLQPDAFADLIVLTGFAVLGLRAWALTERRWAAGLETKPRAVTTLFLLNKPVNHGMRVAQISLWICLLCGVESLEDVFFQLAPIIEGHTVGYWPFGPTLLLAIFLYGAAVCRAWGAAELSRQGQNQFQLSWTMLFPWQRKAPHQVWILRIVYLTALLFPLLLLLKGDQLFFRDHLDRIELAFVWIASSVAANRWLNVLSFQSVPECEVPATISVRSWVYGALCILCLVLLSISLGMFSRARIVPPPWPQDAKSGDRGQVAIAFPVSAAAGRPLHASERVGRVVR